jgi:hypothetical protein
VSRTDYITLNGACTRPKGVPNSSNCMQLYTNLNRDKQGTLIQGLKRTQRLSHDGLAQGPVQGLVLTLRHNTTARLSQHSHHQIPQLLLHAAVCIIKTYVSNSHTLLAPSHSRIPRHQAPPPHPPRLAGWPDALEGQSRCSTKSPSRNAALGASPLLHSALLAACGPRPQPPPNLYCRCAALSDQVHTGPC